MASCYICNKNPGKFSLSGLGGKICPDCQKNISNIRTGNVCEAKLYFESLNIISSSAKQFVSEQYARYAYAAENKSEEAEMRQQRIEFERAVEQNMANMLLSTTPSLDGYRIVKYIDIVYSEAIYKLSLSKAFSNMISDTIDSFRIFSNNELSGTSSLIQEAKDYVKNDLVKKAASLGANAIVGIDIESSVGSDGVAKASINGTAVIIEKIEE